MSFFAKSAAPSPPRPSIAELVAELRDFAPPSKPLELIEAEAARAEAQKTHETATAAVRDAAEAWRAAQQGEHVHALSREEIFKLQKVADERGAELNAARKLADEVSLAWRREYAKALRLQMWPLRRALHAMAGEIREAARALGEVSTRATCLRVGTPWAGRNSDNFLALAERLATSIDFDKKLGGS